MKNLAYLIIFFLISASSRTKKLQVSNHNGLKCSFSFPKEANITKVAGDDPSLDWLVELPHNKVIFISTNDISGSPLNKYKLQQYGENIVVKILASDSLILKGKNSSGNWKEVKKSGIVYGYMNIPDTDLSKFEKLIIPECKTK